MPRLGAVFLVLTVFLGLAADRETTLASVRALAASHVKAGAPLKTELALDLYGKNDVGIGRDEIVRVYEAEYNRLKEAEKNPWKNAPWYIAAVSLLIAFLREHLGKWASALGKAIRDLVFRTVSGTRLFNFWALKRYREGLLRKHRELKIPFRPERPLDLSNIFVPLKLASQKDAPLIDPYAALRRDPRMLIKGAPGSGKTILLRHIALRYAEGGTLPFDTIAILVEMSRLDKPDANLESALADEMVLRGFVKPQGFLRRALDKGGLLLLFDGLDEVGSTNRGRVAGLIRDLADKYPKTRFVLTCRSRVYHNELNETVSSILEIQDFTDQQIRRFLRSWSEDMTKRGKSVDQLVNALQERPAILYLARNPLLLTIIAWLYTDTDVVLPHSRAEFYSKSTALLLGEWKPERNEFKLPGAKQLLLQHLAQWALDNADSGAGDRRNLELTNVIAQVRDVLPRVGLDPGKAPDILNEIVERSGLMLAIDGGQLYQFIHLTVQEYFAAVAFRGRPNDLLNRFRKHPDAWREPVKLWCGLGEPADDFVEAVYTVEPVTGLECLGEAQSLNPEIAQRIVTEMQGQLLAGVPAVVKAFGLVGSSASPRGREVFAWLLKQAATDPPAAEALAATNLPAAAAALARLKPWPQVLVNMGDLAVPELAPMTLDDMTAVGGLYQIGTPAAALALANRILPRPRPPKTEVWRTGIQAAFCLAALCRDPAVLEALHAVRYEIPQWDWVVAPFRDVLPPVAGRIVELLCMAVEKGDKAELVGSDPLDSRLVVPACIASGDWTEGRRYSIKVGESLTSRNDRSILRSVGRDDDFSIEQFLRGSGVPQGWSNLVRTARAGERGRIVTAFFSGERSPDREDWKNLFRPVTYSWRKSRHAYFVAIVLTLLAALGSFEVWTLHGWILGIIGIISELVWLLFIWAMSIAESPTAPSDQYWLCTGPGMFVTVHPNDGTQWLSFSSAAAGCCLCYYGVTRFLFSHFGPVGLLAWIPFAGAVGSAWLRARFLERRAKNPLFSLRELWSTDSGAAEVEPTSSA